MCRPTRCICARTTPAVGPTYAIYHIANTKDGRIYVGQTADPVHRRAQHRASL